MPRRSSSSASASRPESYPCTIPRTRSCSVAVSNAMLPNYPLCGQMKRASRAGATALRRRYVRDLRADAVRELLRLHAEQRVAVAARGPDLLVAQQRLVQDHRQVVAERGHATDR